MSKELVVLGLAAGVGAILWYKTGKANAGRKKTVENASGQVSIWNDPDGYDTILGYSTPLAGQFGPGGTPDNITSVGNRIFGQTAGNGDSASQNQVFFRPSQGINSQPDLSGALGSSGLNQPDEIAFSLVQDSIKYNVYPFKTNVDALNELYYLEPNLSSNAQDSDITLQSELSTMPPGNNTWAGAAA